MLDEVDEYMSDALLIQLEQSDKSGKRKSALAVAAAESRCAEKRAKVSKKEKRMAAMELMSSNRELVSSVSLPSENLGRKLLGKLGYSGIGGLGKHEGGIIEPIPIKEDSIDLAHQKLGLGVLEEKNRKETERSTQKLKAKDESVLSESKFLSSMSSHFEEKSLKRNIARAEKVVYELDTRHGDPRHELWPITTLTELMSDVEDAETKKKIEDAVLNNDPAYYYERLLSLLNYLRSRYFYCLFCGCEFEDEQDLSDSCPGLDEICH